MRNQQPSVNADGVTEALGGAGVTPGHPQGADKHAISAVTACVSLYERSFAAAVVKPSTSPAEALSASELALVGRSLALKGNSVWLLEVRGGALQILPVAAWDVRGTAPDPMRWTYGLDLYGPSGGFRVVRPAESVLHFRMGANALTPWNGQAPMAEGRHTSALASTLEERLAQEASGPVGSLIWAHDERSKDQQRTQLEPLNTLRGRMVSRKAGMVADKRDAQSGYRPFRVGADIPAGNIELRRDVQASILAAFGVPQAMLGISGGSDAREGYRRFLHATMQPLGSIVALELQRKIDPAATVDFSALMAGDISGRARAFQSMVGAGMEVEKAAALAGLMLDD